MAIFTPGASVSEISGSIANVTYSRNRGGAYTKTKMIQTNPNSPAQVAARALTASAVAAWKLLSPAVQDAWIQFANTQESKPILSKRTKLSGYTAFIRFHITRNRFGLSGDPLPKIQEPFTNFFGFSFTTDTGALIASITGTNLDANVLVVFYLSDSVSPGRTSIPESKAVIMRFLAAPNGVLTVNLSAFWVARFGPLSAAGGNKIFCRIEIVNRLTAQAVALFRSSSIVPNVVPLVVVTQPAFGNMTSVSEDGLTWSDDSLANAEIWQEVAYSASLNLFVAVSAAGSTTSVMTSPDGVIWTLRTLPFIKSFSSVLWIPFLNLFIATAIDAVGSDVATSPDGITWTSRTTTGSTGLYGIAFDPTSNLIVVCDANNAGSNILTSSDGITWTTRTTPANLEIYDVTWSPSLSLFVAVGNATSTYSAITSPDGINWTARTSPTGYFFTGLAWSPSLALFCAVAAQPGTDIIMTSPDGINWTTQTNPSINLLLYIVWSARLSLFVATIPDASTGQILTSPDGVTWTVQTTPDTGSFYGIVAT